MHEIGESQAPGLTKENKTVHRIKKNCVALRVRTPENKKKSILHCPYWVLMFPWNRKKKLRKSNSRVTFTLSFRTCDTVSNYLIPGFSQFVQDGNNTRRNREFLKLFYKQDIDKNIPAILPYISLDKIASNGIIWETYLVQRVFCISSVWFNDLKEVKV